MDIQRLGEVADLRQTGLGEGVGRPWRNLVEVQVSDDGRLDAAVTGQLRADRRGRHLIADEQTALGRGESSGPGGPRDGAGRGSKALRAPARGSGPTGGRGGRW